MKKIKVVYNACFGGFGLSKKAVERLVQLGMEESEYDLDRHDSRLVQVVEELGSEACGSFADLQIAKIKGNKYRIDEYDGNESVQTPDDIDWIVV